jgi:magnesium transporter
VIAHVANRRPDDAQGHLELHKGKEAAARLDDAALAWIDIAQPSAEDIAWLQQRFKLHPMAARDIEHRHQRPKLDEYGETYFGVLYAVGSATPRKSAKHRLQLHEMQFLWTQEHLVTIHWEAIAAIDELSSRIDNGTLAPTVGREERPLKTADLTYELIDAVVDGYFPTVDALAEWSANIEEEMFSSRRSSATLQSIFGLKKDLFGVRKVVAPARDVINVLLRRDHHLFSEDYFPYFQDLYDRCNRVIDSLDTYRDLLSTAMDTYLSFVSNDVNQTVKRMTAVTAILMADALVAGIYGMNFVNMPELRWEYGYPFALVLMTSISLVLYVIFKRIRWF